MSGVLSVYHNSILFRNNMENFQDYLNSLFQETSERLCKKILDNQFYNASVKGVSYSKSDTLCIIDDDFTSPINPGMLKSTVTYLKFGLKYNHQIVPGVIPDSVEYLYIGPYYEHKLDTNCLPAGLKQLYIGVQQSDLIPSNPHFEIYLHDGVDDKIDWKFIKNMFGYFLFKNRYAHDSFDCLNTDYYEDVESDVHEKINIHNLESNVTVELCDSDHNIGLLKKCNNLLKRKNSTDLVDKVSCNLVLKCETECDEMLSFSEPEQIKCLDRWNPQCNNSSISLQKNLDSNLTYNHYLSMDKIQEEDTNTYISDADNPTTINKIIDTHIDVINSCDIVTNINVLPSGTPVSYFLIDDIFKIHFRENVTFQKVSHDLVILARDNMMWSVPVTTTLFMKQSEFASNTKLIDETLSNYEQREQFFQLLSDHFSKITQPCIIRNDLTIFDIVLDDFEVNNCSEYFNRLFYGEYPDVMSVTFEYIGSLTLAIKTGVNKIKRIDKNLYIIGDVTTAHIFDTCLNVVQLFFK